MNARRESNLIVWMIDNPVKVAATVIVVVLFGLLTITPPWLLPSPIRLPVQLTPNLDQPVVSITTTWQGASPEEIEREIIEPQEEQLKGLSNLTKMVSTATEGNAEIRLEFVVGVDQNIAKQDASDALRRVVYQIPQNEFDNPIVITGSAQGGNEIAWLILSSDDPDFDPSVLYDFVTERVEPLLERVEGIADIKVFGGREREVQVIVDAPRLAQAGIPFDELRAALQGQNTNISAGSTSQGKRDVAVRTMGQFTSLDDVRRTVIRVGPGGPIRVGDVAEVVDGYKKPTVFVRSSGKYTLALPAYRETGSNVIEVMEGLRDAIARANKEILAPRGLKLNLTQVYDETVYINSAIRLVTDNIWVGSILTILVLVAFLRNFRATLVVALSIPISIIATFLVVPIFGRSMNVVMLGGLAFAVGMVVDNAIVVLENIFRHREMGKDQRSAAADGGAEVWGAVLASSGTTMIVFLPIIFVKEEAGQLFTDIAIAVSGAVGLSMLVSVCVIPPLAARMLGRSASGFGRLDGAPGTSHGRVADAAYNLIVGINRRAPARLAVVLGFMIVSIGGSWLLAPKASYLPSGNRNLVFGFMFTPPGYNLHEFRRMAGRVESGDPQAASPADRSPGLRRFWEARTGTSDEQQTRTASLMKDWSAFVEARKIPELEKQLAQLRDPATHRQKTDAVAAAKKSLAEQTDPAARSRQHSLVRQLTAELRLLPARIAEAERSIRQWRIEPPAIEDFFFVGFQGTCFVGCTSADPQRVQPLINVMSLCCSIIPDAFPIFFQPSIFGEFVASGNTVEVEVRADNLKTVTDGAKMLQMALMAEFGVYPEPNPPNFDRGRLEARLTPDRERAGEVDMTVADVGLVVRACGDGAIVGQYRDAGKSYDLAVLVKDTQDLATGRGETRGFSDVQVATRAGRVVPLSALCRVEEVLAPQQINHIETQRSVQLTVRPPPGKPLAEVVNRIDEIVAEMRGPGYQMPPQFGGFPARLDPSVIVRLAGNASKLRTTWDSLKWLLLLSGLVCYLLMAGLFESFSYPLVIMTTVPLAVVGGFLGIALVHWWTWYDVNAAIQELDVLAILGFVILLGVVVNNGILIVHQSLNFHREGQPMWQAIGESVRTRLRPILMTSLTTVIGLLPLVLRPGAGAEIYRGLGAVVLMGLLLSTVFTLIVVPAALSLFVDLREWVIARLTRRPSKHRPGPSDDGLRAAAPTISTASAARRADPRPVTAITSRIASRPGA